MAMFIKLFATNIVANSFFGRSNSLAITSIEVDLFSKPSLILDLVKEKRATSAPDIKAEEINSIMSIMILVIMGVLMTIKFENKIVGSGSKIMLY
ncbi:hypothetical protein GCM10008085_03650 [Winogradskyella epiphytica]|nr:hypothetical protein GCM10008085_03650 [Winogradskyella epiphytica]